MTTQHTPTPWTVEEKTYGRISIRGPGCLIGYVFKAGHSDNSRMHENAAYIVRAVNAHADLVAAAVKAFRVVNHQPERIILYNALCTAIGQDELSYRLEEDGQHPFAKSLAALAKAREE